MKNLSRFWSLSFLVASLSILFFSTSCKAQTNSQPKLPPGTPMDSRVSFPVSYRGQNYKATGADLAASFGGGNTTDTSGRYNPTIAGTGTFTTSVFMFLKVGKIVHVSGSVFVILPVQQNEHFSITLPFASNLSTIYDVSGVISGKSLLADADGINIVRGDASLDVAVVDFAPITNTANIYIQFDYIIN